MGFLDGLCDYDEGEAEVSWSSFWRLENLCALNTLGSVVSFLAALVSCIAITAQWYSAKSATRSKKGYQGLNGGSLANGHGVGGREESKGNARDDEDEFGVTASEPLLNGIHRSSHADLLVDDDDDYYDDHQAWTKKGDARGTAKKGTAVHWLKLLLYWLQAFYHLGVGTYDLVDGHADDPYKCELFI